MKKRKSTPPFQEINPLAVYTLFTGYVAHIFLFFYNFDAIGTIRGLFRTPRHTVALTLTKNELSYAFFKEGKEERYMK
jgi:hypothetical protein